MKVSTPAQTSSMTIYYKKRIRALTTVTISILLLGCNHSSTYKYQTIYYQSKQFAFSPISLEPVRYDLVNNLLKIEIWNAGDTISIGRFKNGQKVGEWNYNVPTVGVKKIDWRVYYSNSNSISISIPNCWQVEDFKFNGGIGVKMKAFKVLDKDSVSTVFYRHTDDFSKRTDIDRYIDAIVADYKSDDLIDSVSITAISIDQNTFLAFLEYNVLYNEKLQKVLNMIVWNNGELYEAGMSIWNPTSESEKSAFYLYLIEMFRTMKCNELFAFPYSTILKVENS